MKRSVYIETTIPSYYCDDRAELMRDITRTREWWDSERGGYECFASAVVIDELSEGEYPTKAKCLACIQGTPMLAVDDSVLEIAMTYHATKVMPSPPVRDALHVAIATYYKVDFLLTWNCRHIANANKFRHLEVVNARMGFATPKIITPHMLSGSEEANGQ